jgi:hypothetical protein
VLLRQVTAHRLAQLVRVVVDVVDRFQTVSSFVPEITEAQVLNSGAETKATDGLPAVAIEDYPAIVPGIVKNHSLRVDDVTQQAAHQFVTFLFFYGSDDVTTALVSILGV